jgi:MYXO-CTERM domain-containing protein
MRAVNWAWVVGVGVALTFTPQVQAQLMEPSGLAVPVPVTQREIDDVNNTVMGVVNPGAAVSLPSLFAYRNETIDYQADAKTEPSTFSPLCSFSGTLVLRGGGCKVTFGWYNAVASGGAPPAANEIYELIPRTDQDVYGGTAFTPLAMMGPWTLKTFTANAIRSDARYKGGQIGFALVGDGAPDCTQTKYSQRELNVMCTNCTPNAPWITTIVYQSKTTPDAYYMAFEDLPMSPTDFTGFPTQGFRNDGDFNDFVFFITGLICAGGGEACDTGLKGACAIGRTDCSVDDTPGECREVTKPTDEECDNVDNDCNGMVDDGAGLCPVGKVCDHGSCVAACGTGEFRCPGGLECDRGFCIDPLCVGKVCEAGKACRAGVCVGACDGVTCPIGEECQLGRCVDLCAGVICADKQVCEKGLCVAECGCRDCGPGRTCAATSGQCVDTGCETQACAANQACVMGACQDKCVGAVCPDGGSCVDGKCQPGMKDQTGGGGGGGDGTLPPLMTAGTLSFAGAGGTAGNGTAGSKSGGLIGKDGEAAGCACRVEQSPASSRLAWLGVVALAGLVLRRRRR